MLSIYYPRKRINDDKVEYRQANAYTENDNNDDGSEMEWEISIHMLSAEA